MNEEYRFCVCGHHIWDHEDMDGGTHECTAGQCKCQQFKDEEPTDEVPL